MNRRQFLGSLLGGVVCAVARFSPLTTTARVASEPVPRVRFRHADDGRPANAGDLLRALQAGDRSIIGTLHGVPVHADRSLF